jgi:hypothetical protein
MASLTFGSMSYIGRLPLRKPNGDMRPSGSGGASLFVSFPFTASPRPVARHSVASLAFRSIPASVSLSAALRFGGWVTISTFFSVPVNRFGEV